MKNISIDTQDNNYKIIWFENSKTIPYNDVIEVSIDLKKTNGFLL